MKKGLKNAGAAAIIMAALCLIILTAANDSGTSDTGNSGPENSQMYAWGSIQKNYREEKKGLSDPIVLQGKSAEITESELKMAADFYKLTGLSEEESLKTAVSYLKKREALYQEAEKNGFTVTEQEVKDYLQELKTQLYESENQDEVLAVIEGFGSEEEYWEYELSVYRKNLPIVKYAEDVHKRISAKKGRPLSQEEWMEYYEQLKNTLVEQQNYRELSHF